MNKTTAPRSASSPDIPELGSIDNPEFGTIGVQIGEHRIPISSIEHWVEDGLHVFRSTEFDCMSEDTDQTKAVMSFIDNAEDLFRFLDDVHDAGRATEDETRVLIKLSRRFFELYEADQLEHESENNPRIRNLLGLLRRQSPRSEALWQPQQPAPASFSQPSPA